MPLKDFYGHSTLRCDPPGSSCNLGLGDPIGITWNNSTSAYEVIESLDIDM